MQLLSRRYDYWNLYNKRHLKKYYLQIILQYLLTNKWKFTRFFTEGWQANRSYELKLWLWKEKKNDFRESRFILISLFVFFTYSNITEWRIRKQIELINSEWRVIDNELMVVGKRSFVLAYSQTLSTSRTHCFHHEKEKKGRQRGNKYMIREDFISPSVFHLFLY